MDVLSFAAGVTLAELSSEMVPLIFLLMIGISQATSDHQLPIHNQVWHDCMHYNHVQTEQEKVAPEVDLSLRQQIEDMGFSANK